MGDQRRFEFAFDGCFCLSGAPRWIVSVADRLFVLFLGCDLVVNIVCALQFIGCFGARVGCREFRRVAECFVGDAFVCETIGFVVGVSFYRPAFACAFAFCAGLACGEAGPI